MRSQPIKKFRELVDIVDDLKEPFDFSIASTFERKTRRSGWFGLEST